MPDGKGYTVTFDGVASTTIPQFQVGRVVHTLAGLSKSVTLEAPGMAVPWIFDGGRGLRKLTIEARVMANTFPVARRSAVEEVSDWLDKEGFRKLEISDRPGRHYLARWFNEAESEEWRNKASFDLEFQCHPYLYDNNISVFSGTVESGEPFSVPFPDELVAYPVITLVRSGPIVAPVTLQADDRTLNISSGSWGTTTVTINCINFLMLNGDNTDLELTGKVDMTSVIMSTVSGEFPLLEPSEDGPTLTLTSSPGQLWDVTVRWRRRYR